ncbi:hypothetical protein GJ744_004093 [Endocarpon pusillum]|uniref:Protein YOP1 n=1 Tax=Endocarpon pusillum TaxID=364733 RepID=A0A8H7AUS1_9EURO|nr:hypothetical protein GJ744_004093 [Endocarpon pusillum]
MFGIIADFLASIITILLPVFASYKALRASDPAQLTPWLIYWIILSLILLVESWTVFILGWLPFYSWIRLSALSYLVLPQTQGAKLLYTNYVEPFIATHERQIEIFIGDLHDKGSRAGLGYLKRLIDLVRERAFGLQPTRPEPGQPSQASSTTAASYAQSLLSRFAMPSARTPTTSDFYSMLSGAVTAATSSPSTHPTTTRSTTNPSNSSSSSSNNPNPLIPTHLTSPTDKQTFLSAQREKLAVLMRALDREQRDLDLAYGNAPPGLEKQLEADVERRIREASSGSGSGYDESSGRGGTGMRKNRSDNSFQNIEREEFEDEEDKSATPRSEGRQRPSAGAGRRTTSGGSWNPTTWFGGAEAGSGSGSGEDRSAPDAAAQELECKCRL